MDINTPKKKLSEPKTVDTINLNGKYVNVSDIKSKIVTASTTSAFILAVIAVFLMLFT